MKKAFTLLVALLLAAQAALAVKTLPGEVPESATPPGPATRPENPRPDAPRALLWHTDIETALNAAAIDYRPVLVLFTRPDCGWCHRLKAEINADPDTLSVVQHFVLVEIDTVKDEASAIRYQVRGVPTLVILTSAGTPREVIRGYVPAAELRRSLTNALNPQFLRTKDAVYLELLGLLQQDNMPTGRWAEVMIHLGSKDRRQELHDRIFARSDIPRETIVDLLRSPSLAIRIGALELLEEMAGTVSEFDPWLHDSATVANAEALDKWTAWARGATNTVSALYTPLTRGQIKAHIQDLVSGSRDRSIRSITMLRHAGPGAADVFDEFLAGNPDLPVATRQRIKEVQYTLLLPAIQGMDSTVLAHRLVYGTLDMRLQTLMSLRNSGRRSMRVIREFLQDPDAIVRETAVDVLLAVAGRSAVQTFKNHLQTEKDANVIHRILRGLGEVRSRKGLEILLSYLSHDDEDMVITALASIAKLKTSLAVEGIGKCIDDPRWRVRVAAMDAAGALKLVTLMGRVTARLDDADEFVRFSAIRTLTSLEGKAATDKLEQLFLKEDALKGPIVEAFSRMRINMPPSFTKALKTASPEVLLSVIEVFSRYGSDDLSLLTALADHENEDVACSAIRKMAESGMDNHGQRLKMIRVLRSTNKARLMAALENLRIEMDNSLPAPGIVNRWKAANRKTEAGATPSAPETPGVVNDIMDAFLSAPGISNATGAAASGPATGPTADDLFSAFLGDPSDPGPTPANTASGDSGDSLSMLLEEVEKLLLSSDDPRIRYHAAIHLVRYGSPDAMDLLSSNLTSRTVSERMQIAEAIEPLKNSRSLAIYRSMLQDPSEDIRKAAISGCIANSRDETFVATVFDALSLTNSILRPHEVFDIISARYSYSFASERAARRAAGKWARQALATSANEQIINLCLYIIEAYWQSDDEKRVEPFLRSENPYIRRAALSAWGRNAREPFEKKLDEIARDKSELVRAVIPHVYAQGYSSWIRYLDKDRFTRSYESSSSGYSGRSSRKSQLSDAARKAIMELTSDDAPSVRISAFLCLLSRNETFDLTRLVATLDTIPDQAFVIENISQYVMENYQRLGQGFSILVPYLKAQRWDEDRYDKLLEHFHMGGDSDLDDMAYVTTTGTPRVVQASFIEGPELPAASTNAAPPKLIYFQTPGCSSCRKVEDILAHLPELFPGLKVESHNIRDIPSMRLNEALCERFGVPDNLRLVSPAIFAASGWLIKNDITESRISELLARAAWETTAGWDQVPADTLTAADAAISRRGQAMGLAVVIAAGLLDGLNPCAFATIIFFISYLHIARRKPREILSVGLAFVLGVFLAYFGLGLGLAEVVSRLSFLQGFTRVLNRVLAAATLLFMILNLRDGIRCLRGNLQDMTLQLPGFLKDRIHATIRGGTRQSHFIVAAFLIGVAISFLELACTGQVYAPTILYMLKTGRNVTGALAFLLAYNLAFVAPLVVIFLMAYRGMRSDALQKVLRNHAAVVKFATAALFLGLFLLFVFAPDLQTLFTLKLSP